MAPTPRYFVVNSPEHAAELFPQPEREGMRESIVEMMERNGAPIVVGLTPGQFHAYPVQNVDDFNTLRDLFDWRVVFDGNKVVSAQRVHPGRSFGARRYKRANGTTVVVLLRAGGRSEAISKARKQRAHAVQSDGT